MWVCCHLIPWQWKCTSQPETRKWEEKINGISKFYSIGKNRKPLNSTTQSSMDFPCKELLMDHLSSWTLFLGEENRVILCLVNALEDTLLLSLAPIQKAVSHLWLCTAYGVDSSRGSKITGLICKTAINSLSISIFHQMYFKTSTLNFKLWKSLSFGIIPVPFQPQTAWFSGFPAPTDAQVKMIQCLIHGALLSFLVSLVLSPPIFLFIPWSPFSPPKTYILSSSLSTFYHLEDP